MTVDINVIFIDAIMQSWKKSIIFLIDIEIFIDKNWFKSKISVSNFE